jgi:hypothetical protein
VLTQTVNQDPSSVSVSSSADPSAFGQSVTFTATVQSTAPGSGTPTGSVQFLDGTTVLATQTLASGVATYATSTLALGSHSITVSYSGDGNFTPGTSSVLTQTVNQDSTTTTVTSSVNPSAPGHPVTFTATVAANSPGHGTPTGQVTFMDGGTVLGSATLSGGTASFTTSGLATGTHSITVSYGGDTNDASSTSGVLTQTVEAGATTTTVKGAPNPSFAGLTVTFTATVAPVPPLGGIPTGTVVFKNDGITTLATVTLNSQGMASYSAVFGAGNYVIYAYYSGDSGFSPSYGYVGEKVNGGGGGPGPGISFAATAPATAGLRSGRQSMTEAEMVAASIAAAMAPAAKGGTTNHLAGGSSSAATNGYAAAAQMAVDYLSQTGTLSDLLALAGPLANIGASFASAGTSPTELANLDWLFTTLALEASNGLSTNVKAPNA